MIHTHLLTCPVCAMPLSKVENMLKCASGHSFDIAREGYINLLRKKLPGDTKEMLVARRTFLERGYYRPLSDTINELIATNLRDDTERQHVNILDAGCGEGYYLGQLQHYLSAQLPPLACTCTGTDISKEAVKMAARKYPEACFVVANLKERLVFADQVQDVILNIFAPRNLTEFARILAPRGLLLAVIPSPAHLLQLRTRLHLLNIEEHKEQHVIEQYASHFTLLTTREVHYELHLKQEEVALAVTMTPNYWHTTDETHQAIAGIQDVRTEAGFTCLLFQRK